MTRRFHHGLLIALCCSLLSTNSWGDDAPTVAAEQASFRLADANLSISLVAAEPAVASPVAVAWDEFGGLFVVEMTDYPADGSGGQVKRLEDRDGDGIYEHATLFAEKLAWPSGVLPYISALSTDAPAARSRETTSSCPFAAAMSSGVAPFEGLALSTDAPAARIRETTSPWPL